MNGIATAELSAYINPAEQRVITVARAVCLGKIRMPQRLNLRCTGGEGFDPRRNKSKDPLHIFEWFGRTVREQQSSGHGIQPFEVLQKRGCLLRILPIAVVEHHIATKVRVTAQNLVRAFAGDHDLVPGISHSSAQKIFRDPVSIEAEGLRLLYSVSKVVCQVILAYWNRKKLCADLRGHLSRFFFFVVVCTVKGQRERPNWIGSVPCRKAQHRAGVQAPAKIATDWNIGTQAKANRFFQDVTEFRSILCTRTMQCRAVSRGIVKIPILVEFDMSVCGDQIMSRWDLKNSIKKSTHLVTAEFRRLRDGLGVPTRRHSRRKQRLGLRREV